VKKLILRYISAGTGSVSFRIEEQTHICGEFGNGSSYFGATGNISLDSVACPASSYDSNVLYCRGHDTQCIWEEIKIAVKEYNEHYGYYGEYILDDPNGVKLDLVPLEMFVIE